MVLLGPDPFLNELNRMFERNKAKKSVFINMKRTNMKPRKSKKVAEVDESAYKCLIRVTDGKKKISTIVSSKEQLKFQNSFSVILRAHMDSLKVPEKPKKKVKDAPKK